MQLVKAVGPKINFALAAFVCAQFVCGCNQDNPFIGDADNYHPSTDSNPTALACSGSPGKKFNNSNSPYRWSDEQVIVEVDVAEDLRCPACIAFSLYILDLWQQRPDFQKTVRLTFHHFPLEELHPGTTEIHVASAAVADQGSQYFWALYDVIVQRAYHGDTMGVGDVEDFLEKQTGFDISRFRADRNVDEAKDFVQWDRRQGTRAGVRGTPTVFVCDRKVEFVAKWSELEELIDKLINDYLAQATD